jgi:hypothetical protein
MTGRLHYQPQQDLLRGHERDFLRHASILRLLLAVQSVIAVLWIPSHFLDLTLNDGDH